MHLHNFYPWKMRTQPVESIIYEKKDSCWTAREPENEYKKDAKSGDYSWH